MRILVGVNQKEINFGLDTTFDDGGKNKTLRGQLLADHTIRIDLACECIGNHYPNPVSGACVPCPGI